MIEGYCAFYGLDVPKDELRKQAVEWFDHPRFPLGPRRLAVHPETAGRLGKKLG